MHDIFSLNSVRSHFSLSIPVSSNKTISTLSLLIAKWREFWKSSFALRGSTPQSKRYLTLWIWFVLIMNVSALSLKTPNLKLCSSSLDLDANSSLPYSILAVQAPNYTLVAWVFLLNPDCWIFITSLFISENMIFWSFGSEQRSRGMFPLLSTMNKLAPLAIKNSTTSKLFFTAAKWSAVRPSLS